ncbi:NADH-quinone oxidoreductase subunit L [Pseudoalteromonas ardens]|uniref:Probable inorganic carbon transporter subunit DabB n=1 Tax=Pseudoalteromonas rubra TaxID=43658 RepID=A0A0L0EN98_9GAMM|nr:NADH-quinone oxidoreductase subunit L [Pseudoalteromonas sp. R96]KNC65876.1 NADH dehydrogenase [Pseudoalteromonas rubra]MDK1313117.1 NADH-quinone oxidoreductase subunit L [Pseudoalteromonas sp. R96]
MSISLMMMLAITLSFALSAWYCGRASRISRPFVNVLSGWLLVLLITAIAGQGVETLFLPESTFTQWVYVTPLGLIMSALVVFMAIILMRFSLNYMAGEPRLGVYWRWLLGTLAAVSLVVMSNHLLLLLLGWTVISLALHQLLLFYPERPRAALGAHKKFILARLAELALLIAVLCLYQAHGTFLLTEILAHYQAPNPEVSIYTQIAAVMLVIVALMKCAQLPVHGWLMQVVEAPTPVSALLHAGVINLGGFLMIVFAPVVMQVAAAQWLLLLTGGLTTVLAALIMTTRVSVKVRLAWSTSAQMGLMLVECALGLYELALLHLLAHSVYKAHAFLNSGHAVRDNLQARLAVPVTPSRARWLGAALLSMSLVAMTYWFVGQGKALSMWALLAMSFTLLLAQRSSAHHSLPWAGVLAVCVVLLASYAAMKTLLAHTVFAEVSLHETPLSAADSVVMMLFVSLFVLNWLLTYKTAHPRVQRLSVVLFAGLYLDEWWTRLTLKIWPVKLPAPVKVQRAAKRPYGLIQES